MLVSCSADGSGLSSQSTSNKSHSPASRDFVCLRLGKQSENKANFQSNPEVYLTLQIREVYLTIESANP